MLSVTHSRPGSLYVSSSVLLSLACRDLAIDMPCTAPFASKCLPIGRQPSDRFLVRLP